ncbi:MAG: class I SAM-dependent methyltransferase [Cyanobacteria bacterium SIG28]|nr:class I SAM-dependent methyltransferase [Cyanobacteria bacterium SIG28]
MRIQNLNPTYNYSNKTYTQPNFKNHPDFTRLAKKYNITASSYFRRGPFYGSACKEYEDIAKTFELIFSQKIKNPIKMLIVGIGNSQEPFSYLATIKDIIKNNKLAQVLDLYIVDLQEKPSKEKLFNDSYYEFSYMPDYAKSSFIYQENDKAICGYYKGYYRVNDEIYGYLNSTYDNKSKSQWETRIQEASEKFEPEMFDIISINNTLGYILTGERIDTVKNLCRALKKDGIYITDPYQNNIKEAGLENEFETLRYGLFLKK